MVDAALTKALDRRRPGYECEAGQQHTSAVAVLHFKNSSNFWCLLSIALLKINKYK